MRMQVYISPIATSSEWAELDPLKVMGAICAIGDSIHHCCHANVKPQDISNRGSHQPPNRMGLQQEAVTFAFLGDI